MFLAPYFLCFLVFLVLPVIGTVWWSTRSGSIFGGTKFIGLRNFLELPDVVGAGSSIENTLLFALFSVPPILIGALGIALLLAQIRHGGSIYRFLVYFPVLVPGVVAALIWLFLTNVDFGLFNEVIRLFGSKPVIWLGADHALPVLAVLDVWRNVGYWAMFFVAAIIGLPAELYQAAVLDGASAFARFRHLTLPLMRRILFFAVIVSTIWGLQVFDTALVLTNGGPGTATTTVIYRVWLYVFASNNKVGFASAISLVLILAILVLTLIQMRLLSGRRGQD
jgi:ABC-type sugar transport system permease subunit